MSKLPENPLASRKAAEETLIESATELSDLFNNARLDPLERMSVLQVLGQTMRLAHDMGMLDNQKDPTTDFLNEIGAKPLFDPLKLF